MLASRLVLLLGLVVAPINLFAGTIVAYVEAPLIQASSVPGVITEAFDELPVGDFGSSS
jgi:hypothetical protein